MTTHATDFSLPNVGAGPDPFTFAALPDGLSRAVLFFQRDHYCRQCRGQVQELADRVEEFRERDAEVVSIVPEPPERVGEWQEKYDVPYPLLADPAAEVSADYDQPIRFGVLGQFSDLLGRMPAVVIVDRRPDPPEIDYSYRGSSTWDRPDIEEILAELDQLQEEA